jgi:hypothetical protein
VGGSERTGGSGEKVGGRAMKKAWEAGVKAGMKK